LKKEKAGKIIQVHTKPLQQNYAQNIRYKDTYCKNVCKNETLKIAYIQPSIEKHINYETFT
jgi:hypothetical protein